MTNTANWTRRFFYHNAEGKLRDINTDNWTYAKAFVEFFRDDVKKVIVQERYTGDPLHKYEQAVFTPEDFLTAMP